MHSNDGLSGGTDLLFSDLIFLHSHWIPTNSLFQYVLVFLHFAGKKSSSPKWFQSKCGQTSAVVFHRLHRWIMVIIMSPVLRCRPDLFSWLPDWFFHLFLWFTGKVLLWIYVSQPVPCVQLFLWLCVVFVLVFFLCCPTAINHHWLVQSNRKQPAAVWHLFSNKLSPVYHLGQFEWTAEAPVMKVKAFRRTVELDLPQVYIRCQLRC